MIRNLFTVFGIFGGVATFIGGLLLYFGKVGGALDKHQQQKVAAVQEQVNKSQEASVPPIQQELNELSARMVSDLKQEERLNLNMVAQLRSYQEMMRQIQRYATKVERDIDVIEEISKDEFQQDVELQAQLFKGKKADLVAKHLEEFRASRVGAILAKMKEKEASAVLDVWAKDKSTEVRTFYREVIASFLNNRRRDANPELFDRLVKSERDAGENS